MYHSPSTRRQPISAPFQVPAAHGRLVFPSPPERSRLKRRQRLDGLKKAEAATLAAVAKWDEWPSNRRRTRAALMDSSKQFHRCRQAQCELQASLATGGTETTHRRLLCAIELDEQRMAHLQSVEAVLK